MAQEDFDKIKRALEPHHKRMLDIDRQVAELTQERAILKAGALRDLQETLRLSPELIGHLVAGCR